MNKQLRERLKKIDTVRAELKKAESSAAKEIMAMLKELMQSNPLLVGMKWQQYIPGFNDGEPCEFSISGPYFKFDESLGTSEEGDDGDGWLEDSDVSEEFFEKKSDIMNFKQIVALKKTVKEVYTVFNKLTDMEDELDRMFDTNTEIIVTAKGVECEDYDCGF